MSQEDPYLYPGTDVLRNKLGLTDAVSLDRAERELVLQRTLEGTPTGRFDLPHLQAIHHHLFQDVYDWAGKIRTVEIAKGETQFMPKRYIETGIADVHRRLESADFLKDLSRREFADAAGEIVGDINHVHPFREGNGRTQLLYLDMLAYKAGHEIDVGRFDKQRWIEASKAAHNADYGPMREEIRGAMPSRYRGMSR